MPFKKDESGRRWVEMEFRVPGTPEQVWQAVATGAGMSAWFTPTTVDETVGGAITFDFGAPNCGQDVSSGTVTGWEPPVRFAYEEPGWSGEAPPLATEIVVTSDSGDECTIRMVHSLFTTEDDWDDELKGFEMGWPGFFDVLRIYLGHFAGLPAASVRATVSRPGGLADLWAMLTDALGLSDVTVGARCESSSDAPRLAGVIERVDVDGPHRHVVVRTEQPGGGAATIGSFSAGDDAMAAVGVHLYGDGAAALAEAEQDRWTSWLENLVAR